MSNYVTYYAVVPKIEIFPALMLLDVGFTDDGNTVYLALDSQEDAEQHRDCEQCFFSKAALFSVYPELEQVTTEQTEVGPIEVPRLARHEWA